MKTYIRIQTLEDTLGYIEKQIQSLEDSAMFGSDDDLGLAHLYMSKLRTKVLLDLRKIPLKEAA
jgi:hypothetical protein